VSWKAPRLTELRGPDAVVLRTILADLERFLADPVFWRGIRLGDGERSYDETKGISSQPKTRRVVVDSDTGTLDVL